MTESPAAQHLNLLAQVVTRLDAEGSRRAVLECDGRGRERARVYTGAKALEKVRPAATEAETGALARALESFLGVFLDRESEASGLPPGVGGSLADFLADSTRLKPGESAELDGPLLLNLSGLVLLGAEAVPAARRCFAASLKAARAAERWQLAAAACNNLGAALRREADLEGALIAFEQAAEWAAQAKDPVTQADALANAGLLHQDAGRTLSALERLEHARDLDESGGGVVELAKTLNNLGLVERAAGKLPEAEEHLRRGLALFEQAGKLEGRADALTNLGGVLRDRGDPAGAEAAYRQALDLDDRTGNTRGKGRT